MRDLADRLVPVAREENQDLGLILFRKGKCPFRPLAADDVGDGSRAKCVNQAPRNGCTLREKTSLRRCA